MINPIFQGHPYESISNYSVVLIKPDAVKNKNVEDIVSELRNMGNIRFMHQFHFNKNEAENFYSEHKEKDFFNRQVEFMCSGNCYFIHINGENIVNKIREKIGNSDPEKAGDGTIRKKFGTILPYNAIHASANESDYLKELEIMKKIILRSI